MPGVLTHEGKGQERVQDLKEVPLKYLTGCPDSAILIATKQGESNYHHTSEPARVFIHLDNPPLWEKVHIQIYLKVHSGRQGLLKRTHMQ